MALCAHALVIPDRPALADVFKDLESALIEYANRQAQAATDLPRRRYND
jgi:hypothetical protein